MTQNQAKYVEPIYRILIANGLKATTMDSVAAALGISKRTLYETFADKRSMIAEVLHARWEMMRSHKMKLIENASNVMEGVKRSIDSQKHDMERMSSAFLKDLDRYPEIRDSFRCRHNSEEQNHIQAMISRGQKEGVFRRDLNYALLSSLISLQMESLKRMEAFLPPGLTIGEAFNVIAEGMLRTMATPKGLMILVEMEAAQTEQPETTLKKLNTTK